MVLDVSKITGIGNYERQTESGSTSDQPGREIYLKNGKAFLILNKNTIEVRCDARLIDNLKEKYESVMDSRYFGRGGIEIVLAGKQFTYVELADLVRLSYQLTIAP